MMRRDLERAGRALYGRRWKTQLARDLDVGQRMMFYWLDDTWPLPAETRDKVAELLRERRREIGAVLDKIRRR